MQLPRPAVYAEAALPTSGDVASPTPRRFRGASAPIPFIALAALYATAVFSMLVWIVLSLPPTPGRKNATENRFCCSTEAARMLSTIERNIRPCRDFFAHVCKNAISDGIVKQGATIDIMEDMSGKIITGNDLFSSPSAAALHRYYTSCLREVWQDELRFKDATTAVIEISNATTTMSSAGLLRFALTLQYRYRIAFFFTVSYYRGEGLMFARNYVRTHNSLYCKAICLRTALAVANAHFGTNYTFEEIAEWERRLPGITRGRSKDEVTLQEMLDAFSGLDAPRLKAILEEFSLELDAREPTYAWYKEAMLEEIRLLGNTTVQPLSLCYMMIAVVPGLLTQLQIYPVLNSPGLKSTKLCKVHGYNLRELWRRTSVTALTSEGKNIQFRKLFEATRQALSNYAPVRKIIAAGNDSAKFKAFIGNMSILLPMDLVVREFAEPNFSTQGFVRNYFRGLSFEYDLARENKRRGMLIDLEQLGSEENKKIRFVNNTALYVPEPVFALLSANTTDPMLADAPVIGTEMASSMWASVVGDGTWSPLTQEAIWQHSHCIGSSVPGLDPITKLVVPIVTMGLNVALTAMGALPSFPSKDPAATDWHAPKTASGFYRLSNAEFFYLRYAYFRCSEEKNARILVNAPLKLIPDFSAAFRCPANKAVPTSLDCVNVTQEPTSS